MFKLFPASLLAVAYAFVSPAFAASVPVDMGSWVGEGTTWSLSQNGTVATQTSNSPTSVFFTGAGDFGKRYSGNIRVNTKGDDDFIGFVFGYRSGDISGPNAPSGPNAVVDYILIDWKQANQSGGIEGMAASHVTGNIYSIGNNGTTTTGSDAWRHRGSVEEIARANTRGDTGWADKTSYRFTADFDTDRIRLFINDTLEFDLMPDQIGATAFADGSFGFYAFSQTHTEFSAVEVDDLSDVPLPAGLTLIAGGLATLGLVRRAK
ncbi:MAG: hypothetical protein AAGF71_14100 [Pseudomonadota bacterium]